MASHRRLSAFCLLLYKSKKFKMILGVLLFITTINLIIGYRYTIKVKHKTTVLDENMKLFMKNLHSNGEVLKRIAMFKTSLIVCVLSHPGNNERRAVIRQTWALNKQKFDTLIFFFIGTKKLKYGEQKRINNEREEHGDLILLKSFEDTYEDLTLKVLEVFQWVHRNVIFDYLMKVDDDTFIRLDTLLNDLESKPTEGLYWGYFNEKSPVVTEGPWAEPKQYICDTYVSYALGGGYILSKDLVQYVTENSDKLKIFKNEDVSVGTWLAPLQTNSIHDDRFRMSGDCEEKYIVLHYSSIKDMKMFNQSLLKNGTLCGETAKLVKRNEENTKTIKEDNKTAEGLTTASHNNVNTPVR